MDRAIKKHGRVIRRYKRNIPIEDFDQWRDLIRRRARGVGLYALYDGSKLVYVGRATGSIRARIQAAKKTKEFTHFSVFLVVGASGDAQKARICDLEALVLKIVQPLPIYNLREEPFAHARKLTLSNVGE